MSQPDWRQFWGKARPADDAGASWHPLWMHSLDVAAVARVLSGRFSALFERTAAGTGWTANEIAEAFAFLAVLHDIGKFTRAFQKKAEHCWLGAVLGPLDAVTRLAGDPGHAATGLALLLDHLDPLVGRCFPDWQEGDVTLLLGAAIAHHGRPVESVVRLSADLCRREEIAAAGSFADAMERLLHPPQLAPPKDGSVLPRITWIFAGLVVLADWLGSDQAFFPYQGDREIGVEAYWAEALSRAEKAVVHAGLASKSPSDRSGFQALTGFDHPPSPVQAWAEQVTLPQGPVLFLIEDMTGSGKTEAALVLAQRLMAAGRADGLYFALPTMATANAAYDRLAGIYRRLYAEGERPSLVLAHGRAALHDGFAASILHLSGRQAKSGAAEDADSAAESAAWLASEGRKALLADIGVGTIDQALLAVLPARHQALRLTGLAGKVLIIDEAHAYDAYMGKELARLASFQAYLGGAVIILSATLPAIAKGSIVAEWRKAAGGGAAVLEQSAYPLATIVSDGGAPIETALRPRPDLPRTLGVARLADAAAAVDVIVRAAEDGAAVAWIRNTVDDVLDGAELLRQRGFAPDVFHARMAMQDRLAIETAVVRRFGKEGGAEERRGRILVASQVVEQSLDLDFDAMVSDLAPVDLLLQRAGRLWRHMLSRPASVRPVAGPMLHVVSPDPFGPVDDRWFTRLFPRASAVYADHLVLWRTAEILFSGDDVRAPEDMRRMIEHVYGTGMEEGAPQALLPIHYKAMGRAGAERSAATTNLLLPSTGYAPDNQPWVNDVIARTRLSEPTRVLRLARWDGVHLRPWADAETPDHAWALSEVSVRAARVAGTAPFTGPLAVAVAEVIASWGRYDGEKLLVPLTKGAEGWWVGQVLSSDCGKAIHYNPLFGLRF